MVKRSTTPTDVDPQLRPQLLSSLRDLLSKPVADVSPILPFMAQQALWEVAGHDVATAMPYVDEIRPMSARYAATLDLARHDPDGYARIRRPRQLLAAAAVVIAGAVLALIPATRAAGFCVMLAAAAWAFWTSRATSVRDLPPPSLMLLTVPAIGFLGGGAIAGLSTWIQRKWLVRGSKRFGLSAATVVTAGFTALALAGWSRSTRRFPIGGEGLEMVFDPLAAGMLAALSATVLLTVVWLVRRGQPTPTSLEGGPSGPIRRG